MLNAKHNKYRSITAYIIREMISASVIKNVAQNNMNTVTISDD